jgi:hypothetical protein
MLSGKCDSISGQRKILLIFIDALKRVYSKLVSSNIKLPSRVLIGLTDYWLVRCLVHGLSMEQPSTTSMGKTMGRYILLQLKVGYQGPIPTLSAFFVFHFFIIDDISIFFLLLTFTY